MKNLVHGDKFEGGEIFVMNIVSSDVNLNGQAHPMRLLRIFTVKEDADIEFIEKQMARLIEDNLLGIAVEET